MTKRCILVPVWLSARRAVLQVCLLLRGAVVPLLWTGFIDDEDAVFVLDDPLGVWYGCLDTLCAA